LAALAALGGAACADTNAAGALTDAGADARGEASVDAPADGGAATDAQAPDGPNAVGAVDDFIAALARAMCAWQFRCCNLTEIDGLSVSSYLTEADCRWATELSLGTWFASARASVADGRLSIDPGVADACVQRFAAGGCAAEGLPAVDPFGQIMLCADPFVGRVPEGSLCWMADECAPGSRCVLGGQVSNGAAALTFEGLSALPTVALEVQLSGPGACLAYVPEGGRCRVTYDCAPGLYCRGVDFVCAKPAGAGQPCHPLVDPTGIPSIGPPCDDATQTLICAGDVCGHLPEAGEPCLADGSSRPPCDPDAVPALACVGAGFNGPGICETLGALGAACGPEGLAPCAIDLTCIFDAATPELGTCGPLPGPGESCELAQTCAAPDVCDPDTSTCGPGGARHDGEPCLKDNDCASENCFVNADGGTCGLPTYGSIACTGRGAVGSR
jgi:hypothetical protein